MMKARWGRIVNVSSIVGVTGNPGQANYAASKAGVIGMSKSLAAEVASRGITVNCVAPGFIATAMTEKLTEEQKARIHGQIPAGRMGAAAEIAAAAAGEAAPARDQAVRPLGLRRRRRAAKCQPLPTATWVPPAALHPRRRRRRS